MRPGGPGIFSCLSPLSTALDKGEQDPGGTARLRKLYGTKSSVGGGASGAHPAYTWKRGQIWECAQLISKLSLSSFHFSCGPSAWNDLSVELRSLLMTRLSKFYISLKSFFFGHDWAGSTSE